MKHEVQKLEKNYRISHCSNDTEGFFKVMHKNCSPWGKMLINSAETENFYKKLTRRAENVQLLKLGKFGDSLVVQWLRHLSFTAVGMGSVSGGGTKIPQTTWPKQKTRVGIWNTYNFVIYITDKGLCLE